jgi:putative spermidine/putrescine transport system permease protein
MTAPAGTATHAWRSVLPATLIVAVPVTYALIQGVGASFGVGVEGADGVSFAAYRRVLATPGFDRSLAFTLWIAAASAVLAVTTASVIAWVWTIRPGRSRRLDAGMVHLTVSIPHVAWAVALAAMLSQSGWLARLTAGLGLIDRPDQFPVIVGDQLGIGIILHIVTKEAAFVTIAALPLANRRARGQVAAAATLGASRAQQFRMVFLPALAPALLPAAVVVFAFGLGSYEPAAVLGVQNPRALSIVALDSFRDPDLTRRADAFAISTILGAITVVGAVGLWLCARRWVRPVTENAA